jgi:leader peptidase (prepilin peptidase)/N-methyltransferase
MLGAALAVVMWSIAFIDWRRLVIPNTLTAVGFVLALIHASVRQHDSWALATGTAFLRAATLALVFLAIRGAYARLRGRQGLGLGDVKLAAVAGAWLDWMMMPLAIEIAATVALLAYVTRHLATGHRISATTRLPFGLFLAPSIWICWVFEARLLVGL